MINSVNNVSYPKYVPAPVKRDENGAKLGIFYINDMHGNIDNMKGMVAASDWFDKEAKVNGIDPIKLSGGDNFSGGNADKNNLVVGLLSRMGINASAVGNHEFDSTINTFYKFLRPNSTKFLAANAKTPAGSEFYNNVQKSAVFEINGNKYGVIGLLPFDLETVTGADDKKMQGVRPETFEKSVEIVNEEAKKLTEQGINKIILVSHIGNDNDKKIAPALRGVDVIVGGHSHTEVKGLSANQNLFSNADNDPIIVLQTGENSKNVGVLNVEFDNQGVIKSAQNNLIQTSQNKSPVLDYLKDAALGKSPEIGGIKFADPLPVNRRKTPCAWTNLMCDAIKNESGADISFINASNTRKVPKSGKLTERDVQESTPLKNTLLVKKMTEKEVVRAIKDALQATYGNETGEPGILHTSGLSYSADTKGNLLELNFVDKNGNKTPIDINNPTDKVYSACYDSFVAKGTEYPVFVPEKMTYKEIDKTFNFDKDKFLIDYINKMPDKGELTVKDDNRIKIIKEDGSLKTVADDIKDKNSSLAAPAPVAANQAVVASYANMNNVAALNKINSLAALNAYAA